MWSQADLQRVEIGDVACSGWKVESGQLKVVWETPDHIASIEEIVALLTEDVDVGQDVVPNDVNVRREATTVDLDVSV